MIIFKFCQNQSHGMKEVFKNYGGSCLFEFILTKILF